MFSNKEDLSTVKLGNFTMAEQYDVQNFKSYVDKESFRSTAFKYEQEKVIKIIL